MIRRIAPFGLCTLLLACGPDFDDAGGELHPDPLDETQELDSTSEPLTGGTRAKTGQFPSTLFITINPGFTGYCTAAKVGPRHILTAGHCLYKFSQKRYLLKPGDKIAVTNSVSVDRGSGGLGKVVSVKRVIAHPAWVASGSAPTGAPDMGMIEVESGLGSFTTAPLSVATVPAGTWVYLQGYGCENGLEGSTHPYMSYLNYDYTPTVSTSTAFKGVTPYADQVALSLLDDTYFFTRGQGATSATASLCPGDSGGPVYRRIGGKYYTVGINSYYSFKDGGNLSVNNWFTRLDYANDNRHDTASWAAWYGATIGHY